LNRISRVIFPSSIALALSVGICEQLSGSRRGQ